MKRLLFASFLFAAIASAADFPYTGGFWCTPAGCYQGAYVAPRVPFQVASVVDGVMNCAIGKECMVRGGVQATYCSLPKQLIAQVMFGNDTSHLVYEPPFYFRLVYAQDVMGKGMIWTNSGAVWALTYQGSEDQDCWPGSPLNRNWPASSPC